MRVGKVLVAQAARVADHLTEWCHARNRLLSERPGKRDGAEQFAFDVDRASAHAGDDPRVLELTAPESDQHRIATGTGISLHAKHFDVEFFNLGPVHHRLAIAPHSLLD